MNPVTKLTPGEVDQYLSRLNETAKGEWRLTKNKLSKQFVFKDFTAAMKFMQTATDVIDAMDHHPEWCNVYNRLDINLTTHSVDGLSSLDFELAGKLEEIAI